MPWGTSLTPSTGLLDEIFMSDSIRSLIESGTKLWLDSIDPDLVSRNRAMGATGATSNPIIIADLIQSGRFDEMLRELMEAGQSNEQAAWNLTDRLVSQAESEFIDVWEATSGNDGYVSFELDPLLEDPAAPLPHDERVARYVASGKRWSAGHPNRMIKVPATSAGLVALESLAAAGVPLNVTLIFSMRQYREARDAVLRGVRQLADPSRYKSVYSIFVSRIDVYTGREVPQLSAAAQGEVGILNAKRIWADNRNFWQAHPLPLEQEIIFASTGTKLASDPPWKYVAALAGSDIQTNPPATNDAVAASGKTFTCEVDQLPSEAVLREIDEKVDFDQLEETLMAEGIEKFAFPQQGLLRLIAEKRSSLAVS